MFTFYIFFLYIVVQRLVELMIARMNESWMKLRGAIEVGKNHYKYIVIVHVLFLLSLFFEVRYTNANLSNLWPILFPLFIFTQIIRVWALTSLGKYWNTKVLIIPNEKIISTGPYKFIRHPNYLIVTLEFFIIPFLFEAYVTAFVFSVLNIILLSIRIPIEEKALMELTDYKRKLGLRTRFLPKV
ncbi:hypothetical protein LCL95_05235 [Bacillus timonensis]|nr:hypothetical protein [Bacillus timonensis]